MEENPEPEQPDSEQDEHLDEERLSYITNVSRYARTNWFGLLGFLAIASITLAGTKTRDFFAYGVETKLPIFDISVPTALFFVIAPLLIAALYIHLHLYLLKLWEAVAKLSLSGKEEERRLQVFPWLVNDWALSMRGSVRLEHPPSMKVVEGLIVLTLVWAAAPLVLVAFWWQSIPKHSLPITLWIAALFLCTLTVGSSGWRRARRWLGDRNHLSASKNRSTPLSILRESTAAGFGIVLVGAFLTLVSIERIGTVDLFSVVDIAQVDLRGTRLTVKPKDWLDHESAWHDFKAKFASEKDEDVESERRRRWVNRRNEYISQLHAPSLRNENLNSADFKGAFLAAVDFRGASLRKARLSGAQMEAVNFQNADLTGADLRGTDLTGADLRGVVLTDAVFWEKSALKDQPIGLPATCFPQRLRIPLMVVGMSLPERPSVERSEAAPVNLQEAQLQGAQLQSGVSLVGVNMSRAQLTGLDFSGADLRWADLSGADLRDAQLRGADLRWANLQKANLAGADLTKAMLRHADLSDAVFSDSRAVKKITLREADLCDAKLPKADLRDVYLTESVLRWADLSDAKLYDAHLTGTQLQHANLSRAKLDRADLGGAILSVEENGLIRGLPHTNLHNADLSGANLEGAQLKNVNLRGAEIRGTRFSKDTSLQGADLTRALLANVDMTSVNLDDAKFTETAFLSVDLTKTLTTAHQLRSSFGKKVTSLPDHLKIASCLENFAEVPEGPDRPTWWNSELWQMLVLRCTNDDENTRIDQ